MELNMAKLVRDNIPAIIEQQGKRAIIRQASNSEFLHLLFIKLQEEIVEFAHNPNVEELADITEAVLTLGELWGISESSIQKARLQKREINGGFHNKTILIDVES